MNVVRDILGICGRRYIGTCFPDPLSEFHIYIFQELSVTAAYLLIP